jgi:FtsP/CotA-like multicopper oxidase with cupredoxin domain
MARIPTLLLILFYCGCSPSSEDISTQDLDSDDVSEDTSTQDLDSDDVSQDISMQDRSGDGAIQDTTDTGEVPTPSVDEFEDNNDDPNIFEANLTAREGVVLVRDEPITMLTYGGSVPGPEIRVTQGDQVIIHLENQLPDDFPTTIHWHGIEGTNAMDGTQVSQEPIQPGESFTYEFTVPRAGIFWFHPHIRGAQTVFSGLYGTLIVEDPEEDTLREMGILPHEQQTLVLSDVSVWNGVPLSAEIDNAMEIMNGTEGNTLLVNGEALPEIEVSAGGAVRLQVLNTSITRFYRLRIANHTLYRIGGEGGLLDAVRIEGGSVDATTENYEGTTLEETTVDLGYERGEILLGPAQRADLVLVPQGEVGELLTLEWMDYARGRHGMWMEGDDMVMGDADDDGLRTSIDIAHFRLVEGDSESFDIAEGDPILTALGREVGKLDTSGLVVDFTGEARTELQGNMDMWIDSDGIWQMETEFAIDEVSWSLQMTGPDQEEAPNAKRATLGDVIHWEIYNSTSMAHPWHLHGFSFQPVAFLRHDDAGDEHEEGEEVPEEEQVYTRWSVEHDEFMDTVLIPPHTAVFYNVVIEDPNGDGGATGRWLKHCHIFQHGEGGMMSELIVGP